jgi:hypothetical protein
MSLTFARKRAPECVLVARVDSLTAMLRCKRWQP